MISLLNFINGRSSERSQNLLTHVNPMTLKEDYTFVNSDFMDVVASVQSAHKAQKKWQELPASDRLSILKKFGSLIAENIEEFAEFEHQGSGIPIEASRKLCSDAYSTFSRCLNMNLTLTSLSHREFQITSPVGLIGLITDWQKSFAVILENLAVSLSCGNLVILYPSEFGARSAIRLAELAAEAHLPAGVLNVLLGRPADLATDLTAGLAIDLAEHPAIKYLIFYGDNAVGEKFHKAATENQKRITSFLGVNNTAIVFADAGIESAIKHILELSCEFHYHGRNRINRILVQEKILKDFKIKFDEVLDTYDLSKIGPLPNAQLKTRFESYLRQSQKDRAKIHVSKNTSTETESLFLPLTIYDDLTNCSTLHQQDLVGPIAFLQSFKYAVDLPKILNAGAYAGAAYVWTNDLSRIHKLTQQLEVSNIYFNGPAFDNSKLISSNLKQSGFGQAGLEALLEFNLNRRVVVINPLKN